MDLWVMGDNRYDSSDSRFNGPVPIKDVVGRAFVISWPVSRWNWLSDYPTPTPPSPRPTPEAANLADVSGAGA